MKDKRFDIAALGELLIDFTQYGISEAGQRLFEQNPGGAPANVVCAAARLGLDTAFIGKVGKDLHGQFLREVLQKEGVNTDGLVNDGEAFTTMAFVSLDEKGERNFSFARKPGADTLLRQDELKDEIVCECRILNVGSLSMTDEPARTATLEAVRRAKLSGASIAYDPNYRKSLWENEAGAIKEMRRLLQVADYIKLSEDEMGLLTGQHQPEPALKLLLKGEARAAVITLGEQGAVFAAENYIGRLSAYPCKVVDSTGAGDAFWGAFLSRMSRVKKVSFEEVCKAVNFANAAASICVSRRGAIPAMPSLAEVEHIYLENKK